MARRYFNWKLAIVLLIGFVVLAVTAFGLRKWQKSQRADTAIEEGTAAYELHKWDEAASKLGRYISANPEDVEVLKKYAEAQLKRRPIKKSNYQQAIGAYRNILRINNDDSEVVKDLASLYIQMGMPGEAELIISRFLSEFPNHQANAELGTLLATAVIRQRKFEEAAKQLNAVITDHPDHVDAYTAMAVLAAQRPESIAGLFTESEARLSVYWMNKAIENNPSSAEAYIARSAYFLSSQDIEKAKDDLNKAQEIGLTTNKEKRMAASSLISIGELDAAEKYLLELRTENPENMSLWTLLLDHAKASKSNEKVLQVVEEGLEVLNKDPWDFMLAATENYIRCGKLESAQECIDKLNDKEINPGTVSLLEAMLADKQGDSIQAVRAWLKVIEAGSNIRPDRLASYRLALSNAYLRSGDPVSSARVLTELVNENPRNLSAQVAISRQATNTGQWSKAVQHAKNALMLAPNNSALNLLYVQSQIQLAASLAEGKEKEQAINDIEKGVEGIEDTATNILQKRLISIKIAILKQDFETAEKMALQLKTEYPDEYQVAITQARLLYSKYLNVKKKELFEQALKSIRQTMDAFPAEVEPVQFLASVLDHQGQTEECKELLIDSIESTDDSGNKLELVFLLSNFYRQWDQQDDLFKLLDDLKEDYPNSILLKTKLLSCQKMIDDAGEAQKIVDEIKNIVGENSRQWRYHQVLVWLTLDTIEASDSDEEREAKQKRYLAQYTGIVTLLKANIAENPNDKQSRLLLAHSHERAAETEMALLELKQALDAFPGDEQIMLQMASALHRAGEYDQVDEILGKISEERLKSLKSPKLSEIQFQMYLRQGDLPRATDVLQTSIIPNLNNTDDRLTLELLQVQIEMQQENYEQASVLIEKLIESNPDNVQVLLAKVKLQLVQNKNEEAVELSNQYVDRNNSVESYIFRARTFASVNQPDKALEDLNFALSKEPENAVAWVARSDFYVTTGKIAEAAKDIRHAMSLDEDNIKIQKKAIPVLLSPGCPQEMQVEGEALLDKFIKDNPDDIEMRMLKVRSLFALGTKSEIDEAEELLVAITDDHSQNIQAWLLLGEIAFSHEDYGKAIDYALKGLVSSSENVELLRLKAKSEYKRSPVLSISTLKMLCDLDSKDMSNAISLADVYVEIGQSQKAVDLLSKQLDVVDTESGRLRCQVALARAIYKNGQKTQAIEKFNSLIESDPTDSLAINAYAKLLLEDKLHDAFKSLLVDWIEKHPDNYNTPVLILENLVGGDISNSKLVTTAEELLNTINTNHPDRTEGLQILAELYQRTGNSVKAIELYQQVLTIKDDDVIAMNNLAWALYKDQGKYSEALELTNRGLAIAPKYTDMIDTRGSIYLALNEYDKAIADFETCITQYSENNPSLVSTHLHLANALIGRGNSQDAIKHLNIVIEKSKNAEERNEAKSLLKAISGE